MAVIPDQTNNDLSDIVAKAITDESARRMHVNIAAKIVGTADAEDIVQHAYAYAYNARDSFDGRPVGTWLTRIIKNAAISFKRKHKRIVYYAPSWLAYGVTEITPESELDDKEVADHIKKIIGTYSDALQRGAEMMVLNRVDGIEFKDLAIMFGIRIGTVMSSISRTRDKLKADIKRLHEQSVPAHDRSLSSDYLYPRH